MFIQVMGTLVCTKFIYMVRVDEDYVVVHFLNHRSHSFRIHPSSIAGTYGINYWTAPKEEQQRFEFKAVEKRKELMNFITGFIPANSDKTWSVFELNKP